jgi:arginine decarboxylase
MTSTRPAPPPAAPAEPKPAWTIADARALYNIEGWSAGFFDINDAGHVVVRPDKAHPDRELDQ